MVIHLILLILSSLLHTTSSTVYYVIPDDHYTTNNNSYILQHYLNNTNKYFTSHTQLHFLSGQYYLSTDLVIQHVSNLSLIGNRTNEVINSVINCTSPAGIVVVDSSNIVIANIVMNDCGNDYNLIRLPAAIIATGCSGIVFANIVMNDCGKYIWFPRQYNQYVNSLYAVNSSSVTILHFHSVTYSWNTEFTLINILHNLTIVNLTLLNLKIYYHQIIHPETSNSATQIYIDHLIHYNVVKFLTHMIFDVQNININLNLTLRHSKFTNVGLHMICEECSGYVLIFVKNCNFSNSIETPVEIVTPAIFINMSNCRSATHQAKTIFMDCHFKRFLLGFLASLRSILMVQFGGYEKTDTRLRSTFSVNRCTFHNDFCGGSCILIACNQNNHKCPVDVYFKAITISKVSALCALISCFNTHITVIEMVAIDNCLSIFIKAKSCDIVLKENIYILNNIVFESFVFAEAIFLKEFIKLNFTFNQFRSYLVYSKAPYSPVLKCPIQYISEQSNLDENSLYESLDYSVTFNSNTMKGLSNVDIQYCMWDSSSVFQHLSPVQVNKKFINYSNTTLTKKHICICKSNQTFNCFLDEIGPFFPGQHVNINLIFSSSKTSGTNTVQLESVDAKNHSPYICGVSNEISKIKLTYQRCRRVSFIIKHLDEHWCRLSVLVTPIPLSHDNRWLEMYTILLQPCPKGFSLYPQGYCQCDPVLSSHISSLTTCDIDHQTIPRPANTWISGRTINNSHSYYVSLNCPFDYCLPHSSQLNLSTPDSQCQFNRSSVLCGQCQHGLSTVFGSSQCKHCSNIYLLIIIPIGLAGIVLVVLLFFLNITTTDGPINGFLFFTNIIGIYHSKSITSDISVMHAFISLANLDLGIETCFYNGMDDYTKTWLQLVFPIYLIFIATLLIITSRYSTTIQRLTSRRALPVLATLFLLSYTKVLLTVSNVLFSYTSITHLPSNQTTLVWSVDTNVPLFGVKFTVLFIACLILFLVLVPFNVVLIFTKRLSYFKVVTYFKPLLDAYQGPYKIKYHYWTGLQLLMRAIFFGLTSLDTNLNYMVNIILLNIILWVHMKYLPYNSTKNNVLELILLFNLNVATVMSLTVTSNLVIFDVSIALTILFLVCVLCSNLKKPLLRFSKLCPKLAKCFQNAFKFPFWLKSRNDHQIQSIELVSEVPEVDFNYREFQEPLIGLTK